MNPLSYVITCSCRRQTTIHWTGGHYHAEDKGWFAQYPQGWTCSRSGHTQRVPPAAVKSPKTPKLRVII